jgi:hypothetical protein
MELVSFLDADTAECQISLGQTHQLARSKCTMKIEGSAFSQAWPGSPCICLRHDGDKEREKRKRKKKKQGSVEIAESNIQQAIIITRMATLRLCGLAVDNLHTSAAPGPGGYASQAFAANRAERAESVYLARKCPRILREGRSLRRAG